MNALPKLLLALTAAAALSFAHPVKANLITNPGFETGDFTGWVPLGFMVTGPFNGQSPHSGNFQATTSGASSALSSIRFSQSFGQLYLDDISVNPAGLGVPDGGTTVSLLGCALLGLVALRRKLGC
jgi:hypothetical protein